jgi:hypothetical protein
VVHDVQTLGRKVEESVDHSMTDVIAQGGMDGETHKIHEARVRSETCLVVHVSRLMLKSLDN